MVKNTLYRGFTKAYLFYIFEMGDSNNFLVSAFIVKCGGIVSVIVLYPHFFQVSDSKNRKLTPRKKSLNLFVNFVRVSTFVAHVGRALFLC